MAIINGNSNAPNGHRAAGLKIIIVGAGIGGLSAAIALRKNGHHVEVSRSDPTVSAKDDIDVRIDI